MQDSSAPNRESLLDHLNVVDVERIEVARGPQSVLYGSDAIGGVIHIITAKGSGSPSAQLQGQAGSFSTFDESASVSGGGDRYHYRLSASRTDSGGFNARGTSGDRDGYARTSVGGRFGVDTDWIGIDSTIAHIASDLEVDAGADFSRSETDSEQLIFRVAPEVFLLDGRWAQTISYSLNTTARDTNGTGFALPSKFDSVFQEVEWSHVLKPREWATTVVGAEYEREDAKISTPSGTLGADVAQVGVYLDQHLSYGDRVDLTVGARVTDHERFGTNVVGRAALTFRNEYGTRLHGSVANGFKAPTIAQLFDTTFGAANPGLRPEKSLGWDIGLEQSLFDGRFLIDVTWFQNDFDDLILAIPLCSGTQTWRRRGRAELR